MRKVISLILAAAVALLSAASLNAGQRQYVKKTFEASSGLVLPYNVVYPDGFNPNKEYPLFLFLHGAGERGTDNESQRLHGGDFFLKDKTLKHAIIVLPQCPNDDFWVARDEASMSNGYVSLRADAHIAPSLKAVKELVDAFVNLGFVDPSRIYGSGLSMGAMGTFDLALRYPDLYAAVGIICGTVNVERVKEYDGKTAFRFYHGDVDTVVRPEFNKEASEILKAKGLDVEYFLYPGVDHGSWPNAFAEPDFTSWLFKHVKE